MKKPILIIPILILTLTMQAQIKISSPDRKTVVTVDNNKGKPSYSVKYDGVQIIEPSPLGIIANYGDFSEELEITDIKTDEINDQYSLDRIKKSSVQYSANQLIINLKNSDNERIGIEFQVSNNNIGFRYHLPQAGETASCIVKEELTGFDFPLNTTTFLTPQARPMTGWKRTKPSYEEEYVSDETLGTPSKYGLGYTFPCLFHIGNDSWALVSETGVNGLYCGSHLSEGTKDGLYTIAYPHKGENNGFGSASPSMALPGTTPWRTITVGNTLKPIVETTIPFDLVKPLYKPSQKYEYGKSTWSWIMWQDWSMNYADQVTYIDFAAKMGYEYILIDALWDKNIGYNRMDSLIDYARSKGVDVFLWYNSNGSWNDAPQGPKHKMNDAIARKKEMKWLHKMGVKGLKVDFFGGDKQETMRLYEDILSDANEYGLMIIFHGCTLPRGWERMYPNYVGSEAVLASENLIFTQHANNMEAYNACLHPFIRNAVGSMEYGPVLLNERHNRTNNGGTTRRTTDAFQLATSILFQNPVQMFAIAPNNLEDAPTFAIDFMKNVPTIWDETIFIDGYPGKYCLLARRHEEKWYVVGVNAQKEPVKSKISLPFFAGKKVKRYADENSLNSFKDMFSINKSGVTHITIQPNGGVILME